ncbi:MAG: hypothetical protein D6806_03385, partial [Deltaproteobacteria bacterium]
MKGWKYTVPCAITLGNMLLGLASVYFSISGDFYWASWTILWSVLADKLDGTAARLLNASSRFGAELDSMADLVSFGIAPATLLLAIYHNGQEQGWLRDAVVLAGCAVLVMSAACRLSRFNIEHHSTEERFFRGLPTTSAGAFVGTSCAIWVKLGSPVEWQGWLPLMTLLVGPAMVSGLPVPKVRASKNRLFNSVQILLIVVVYAFGILRILPEFLFALLVVY